MINLDNLNHNVENAADIFTETLFAVASTPYTALNDKQKKTIKRAFYKELDERNMTFSADDMNYMKKEYERLSLVVQEYQSLKQLQLYPAVMQLQDDQKVTMFTISDFGFPYMLHTVIKNVRVVPYAQYPAALELQHKMKGKRKVHTQLFYGGKELLIYDGWLDIDFDRLAYEVEDKPNVRLKKSKYLCFDKRYMQDIKAAVQATPLLEIEGKYKN